MGLPAWDAYQRGILTTSVLLNPTMSTFLTVKSHQIHIFRWRHPTKSQSNPIEKPFLDDENRLQSHLLTIKSNQIPLYSPYFLEVFRWDFIPLLHEIHHVSMVKTCENHGPVEASIITGVAPSANNSASPKSIEMSSATKPTVSATATQVALKRVILCLFLSGDRKS